MEKEITEIMSILKDGLKELPAFGSQAWEMMVKGYSIEYWVYSVIGVFILLSSILVIKLIFNKAKSYDGDLFYEYDSPMIAIIACSVLIVASVITVATCLPQALAPDYFIVKSLLGLGG